MTNSRGAALLRCGVAKGLHVLAEPFEIALVLATPASSGLGCASRVDLVGELFARELAQDGGRGDLELMRPSFTTTSFR